MFRFIKLAPGLVAAALAVAGFAFPAAAGAQEAPSYADSGYGGANNDETIHGRIYAIDDTFNMRINDDRGFVDHVHLHQGTIINPTGLTLSPDMDVTVVGYNAGSVFEANEIDTPYGYDGPAPVPAYYGPGWWYPGYAYGYGPSFSLALVFGGGGWYYAHQPWSGHWYDNHPWNGGGGWHGNGGGWHGNGGGGWNANGGSPSGPRSYGTEPRRVTPIGGAAPNRAEGGVQPSLPRRYAGTAGFGGEVRSGYGGVRNGYGGNVYRSPSAGTYRSAPVATYHGGGASYSRGDAAVGGSRGGGSFSGRGGEETRR